MGLCHQGKMSKCSHSSQRGALTGSLLCPWWHLEGTSLALLGWYKVFQYLMCQALACLCACTLKLVLIFAESLSLLVISGASCSRIPVVQIQTHISQLLHR